VNDIESGRLLSVCASYDRRTTGPADALAWADSLAALDYDECERAVIAHYQDSTEWIMPGHIIRRVKAERSHRLARTPNPEAPREIRGDAAAWLAWQRRATRAIARTPREQRAIGGPQ
jgi:hypothetical protein